MVPTCQLLQLLIPYFIWQTVVTKIVAKRKKRRKKKVKNNYFLTYSHTSGGERGIRTPEDLRPTSFQD